MANAPLVTVNLQSYRAVLDDATRISAAVAPDEPVQLEAMIQGMVGADAIALIDPNKPWHLALWMDQMGQQPSGALYLPVSDAPAFEAAIAMVFSCYAGTHRHGLSRLRHTHSEPDNGHHAQSKGR